MASSAIRLLCVVGSSMLCLHSAAQAQDSAPKKNARVLMVTQSAGFKHGSVTRKEGQLSPAEQAITELGISSGLFRVDCTQDAAKDFTKENLQNYDIVFFYTTGDLPIRRRRPGLLLQRLAQAEGARLHRRPLRRRHVPQLPAVLGHDRRHVQRPSVERRRHGDDHRARHGASRQQALGRGVHDQGRDLPVQELAAGEGPRADEPEHGQDGAEEAVPRADRLGARSTARARCST